MPKQFDQTINNIRGNAKETVPAVSSFGKILSDMRDATQLPMPPAFAPIAAILLPTSHKEMLVRIIRSAKPGFIESPEWWENVQKVTKVDPADLERTRNNARTAQEAPKKKALGIIQAMSRNSGLQSDKTLQHMLMSIAKNASSENVDIKELYAMQKEAQARLKDVAEKIRKLEIQKERFKRSTAGPKIMKSKTNVPPSGGDKSVKTDKTQGPIDKTKTNKQRSNEKINTDDAKKHGWGESKLEGVSENVALLFGMVQSPHSYRPIINTKGSLPMLEGRETVSLAWKKVYSSTGESWIVESTEKIEEYLLEDVIAEGLTSDLVSRMTAFIASPQLSRIMAGDRSDIKQSRNLAKTIIYSSLQVMADKAYDTLADNGITRRMLLGAYKKRNEPGSALIMDKASSLLKSTRRFGVQQTEPEPTQVVTPTAVPAAMRQKAKSRPRSGPPGVKSWAPQSEAVATPLGVPVQETDIQPPDSPEIQQPEQKPISAGAMIYRKMKAAARAAEAAGQDPITMANYILTRYEEAKIPEAAIVRRMFDRSRNKTTANPSVSTDAID